MTSSGRPAESRAKRGAAVEFVVEKVEWRKTAGGAVLLLRRAANLALLRAHGKKGGSLTVLLTGDSALRQLNREFRGLDQPTNVLSFPAAANPENYLGDIAIAHGVTAREARETGKEFADHAAHLVVHGVLHLLGYDHETVAGAKIMEPLETAILSELGIADPYAARAAIA